MTATALRAVTDAKSSLNWASVIVDGKRGGDLKITGNGSGGFAEAVASVCRIFLFV